MSNYNVNAQFTVKGTGKKVQEQTPNLDETAAMGSVKGYLDQDSSSLITLQGVGLTPYVAPPKPGTPAVAAPGL